MQHTNDPMKDKIKTLCKQRGINLSKLAELIGITPQTLNTILKGDMRLSTFIRIAEALEVSASTLLPDDSYTPVTNTLSFSVTYRGITVEITQEDILSIVKKKLES